MGERRVQVIKGDPDRWRLRDTLRVIGVVSLASGCLLFPVFSADSQDKDLLDAAALHELVLHRLTMAPVALAALGLLVLLVSCFVPRDEL